MDSRDPGPATSSGVTPGQPASSPYTSAFYDRTEMVARSAAEVLVPMLMDLVHPRSVLDVGCGTGVWLETCRSAGAEEVYGVDGGHIDPALLKIPTEEFRPHDLRGPLDLGRRFDLVLSLEVAEHLPREFAVLFIETLTRHADVVVFSAAIPFQGGIGHVNEQWPEYWAAIFSDRGYRAIDCLRWRVWNDQRVRWWYSQNVILYANDAALDRLPALRRAREVAPAEPPAVVHPQKYLRFADPAQGPKRDRSLRGLLRRVSCEIRRLAGPPK